MIWCAQAGQLVVFPKPINPLHRPRKSVHFEAQPHLEVYRKIRQSRTIGNLGRVTRLGSFASHPPSRSTCYTTQSELLIIQLQLIDLRAIPQRQWQLRHVVLPRDMSMRRACQVAENRVSNGPTNLSLTRQDDERVAEGNTTLSEDTCI